MALLRKFSKVFYMARNKESVVDGRVLESLPGNYYMIRVVTPGLEDLEVRAKACGRMRTNRIRIIVGDWVQVELDPNNLQEGRIVYRLLRPPACYAATANNA